MIPILYDTNETVFESNGLGRLRDCISCIVTEERNGIYECDFEYPIGGANYDLIQVGRIIGVTHDSATYTTEIPTVGALADENNDLLTDENGLSLTAPSTRLVIERDVQPFDIVSFTRPINGVVTFHCVHISYRQSYLTVAGRNINNISDAFALLKNYATPTNPFTYETDKGSTGYLASADGIPKTVRSMLGGIEGSILDAYGGEYEWDKFRVILHSARGQLRNFTIRYGVNMLEYNEEMDSSGTYSSCVPYWTDGTNAVIGTRQDSGVSTITGRGECVPLDVSDKFESQPTKAQVNAMGLSVMNSKNPMIPSQNIHVEFVRLQDMGYENLSSLMECRLCDTIKVVFPFYNTTGQFKIVKTVWDVLQDRYESMELGDLSVTLAEALGITSSNDKTADMTDFVVEQGTNDIWTYRKWNSGIAECWGRVSVASHTYNANGGYYNVTGAPPTGLFVSGSNPVLSATGGITSNVQTNIGFTFASDVNIQTYLINRNTSAVTNTAWVCWYLVGKWK